MIVNWWRSWRRRRILAQPFPPEWETLLRQNVGHYARLNDDERDRLRQFVQVFVKEKYWEGLGGLVITDEIRVTIAGQACLLLLGFGGRFFEQPATVLVYPDEYFARQTTTLPGGIVSESMSMRLGEAWQRGPVILAWSSIQRDIQNSADGNNVILHEFAHVLDMLDFHVDGTPRLETVGQYRNWHEVMTAEYNQLVDAADRHRATLLDQYGATSPAEFFAVATECFFEQPRQLQQRHARLYGVLRDFYKQDPATRMAVHSEEPTTEN